MQPIMNYHKDHCDYDCNTCSKVCPTGAIEYLPLEKKRLTKIGNVFLLEKRCIVYEKKQDCGACAEVCPTHAVYTILKDGLLYPKTDDELCIGCGACERVCPEMPKAIYVEGLRTHQKAKKPFSKQRPIKSITRPDTTEDFPF